MENLLNFNQFKKKCYLDSSSSYSASFSYYCRCCCRCSLPIDWQSWEKISRGQKYAFFCYESKLREEQERRIRINNNKNKKKWEEREKKLENNSENLSIFCFMSSKAEQFNWLELNSVATPLPSRPWIPHQFTAFLQLIDSERFIAITQIILMLIDLLLKENNNKKQNKTNEY